MRVTVDITTLDPVVLRLALQAMSLAVVEVAGSFHLEGVSIDVGAGLATADRDAAFLDSFRQHYAEQAFLLEAKRQGIAVVAREERSNGEVVLVCHPS